jgi:3-hydroxyisobutyrate dehydrogenase-like beta-hydroxyacid dehydrogenase
MTGVNMSQVAFTGLGAMGSRMAAAQGGARGHGLRPVSERGQQLS